jgi:hypothetical protein
MGNVRMVARAVVLALGLYYLVMGIAGFAAITDKTHIAGDLYAGNPPDLLWGTFGVTTALNFIHLLLGAATILSAVVLDRTTVVAWCAVVGFGLVFLYGVISGSLLNINWADNWLYLVSALVVAAAAVLPARVAARVS